MFQKSLGAAGGRDALSRDLFAYLILFVVWFNISCLLSRWNEKKTTIGVRRV